uniref:Protamine-2 n=1 Tax=Saimiri boliviensis boliviensis TaxID=39432 RepID=A0A2K6TU39_SAIBB
MVRYRLRSPSERPHEEYRQLVNRQEQGRNAQEEQGLSPEGVGVYGRTHRTCYRHRRRRCSRRRLYRIHRRRRRSCRRRRRRCCRYRRRHRRESLGAPLNQIFLSQKSANPGGGEDAEGTKLPGPLAPCWKV